MSLLRVAFVFGLLSVSDAHVALTFPPARTYDLDFLDNLRTHDPCGMPKGSTFTDLEANSRINISWHLAYPHQGGYRLEILGPDENLTAAVRLAPPEQAGEFDNDDTTQQFQEVQLPNIECLNCSIRLLRQAAEWGAEYRFWSCADVNIKTTGFTEDCSGHGQFENGRCVCSRTYTGDRCQFKDICVDDSDCNNEGSCIDIQATSYPKKVCYCRIGWFGQTCELESAIKEKEGDLSSYTHTQWGEKVAMYHKIMGDEIDFVVKADTDTWVGIGFRAGGTTRACQSFPPSAGIILAPGGEPGGEPEGVPEGENVAEPESQPEGENVAEPESQPEGESHAEPTSEPEGQAESQPEGEPGGQPEGEPEGEPESEPEGIHGMDCTDLVIGSARGDLGRVADYYTRDRSTPRYDSFFGGTESLVGAAAYEEGRVTTLLFRKKLTASETTDVSFTDSNMHVIWAIGQLPGGYVHIPDSGLEQGNSSVPDFYRKDELKYHGDRPQRGFGDLNFFRGPAETVSSIWRSQVGDITGTQIDFSLDWTVYMRTEEVDFELSMTIADIQGRWFAVGFSDDKSMPNSDIVMVTPATQGFEVKDSWAGGHFTPSSDPEDNLKGTSVTHNNNRLVIKFNRPRNTGDSSNDFTFSDDDCPYLFVGIGAYRNGNPNQHFRNPTRSVHRICITPDPALHETVIIIIALAVAAVAVAAIVAFMKLRAGGGCGKSGKAPVGHQDHVEKGGANGFHNKGYIDGNPAEPQEKYNRTGSMHY